MIVVDTSALVAILLREPEAAAFAAAILSDDAPILSAANHVELARVMKAKRGPDAPPLVAELLAKLAITVTPTTAAEAEVAIAAAVAYPVLNYGDSFAYALAKTRGAPLLFKGDDFSRTDLIAARW